jgi:hypothetical protein
VVVVGAAREAASWRRLAGEETLVSPGCHSFLTCGILFRKLYSSRKTLKINLLHRKVFALVNKEVELRKRKPRTAASRYVWAGCCATDLPATDLGCIRLWRMLQYNDYVSVQAAA